MTKAMTVQSSGASLSAAACLSRVQSARSATPSRMCARTIVETAACPPELKRGEQPWSFSDFRVQKMLGEGVMSSVVHCVCGRSGVHAAIKMYHRDRMNSMNVRQVSREIEIHASLLHPNIVRLYAAFEDADGIYLVQEYASRGDLYVELSRRGGYMAEAHVVKNVLIPFLSALTYMHTQGVLHRDIKPENIMLSGEGEVKVGDFGLAINTTREKPMSRVGTLDYMPPEIVKLPQGSSNLAPASKVGAEDGSAYGLPADAWCVGVLAYELLVGAPPFEAESKEATYTRIMRLEPSLPTHLSDQAKAFIRATLKKDPAQRPTVHQLLRHPWLRTYQRPKSMAMLDTPSKPQLSSPPASNPDSHVEAAGGQSAPDGGVKKQKDADEAASSTAAGAGASNASSPQSPSVASSAGPARNVALGKSLSFSSTMAGRFSAVKPTKPSPFSLLALRKRSDSDDERSTMPVGKSTVKGGPSSRAAVAASREAAAAAAVAEIEVEQAELSHAVNAPQARTAAFEAGKAADERRIVHVQAISAASLMANTPNSGAVPAAPCNTPTAAAAPASAGDLIPAALHSAVTGGKASTANTSQPCTPRSGGGSHQSGSRGSFAAAIKHKLSSMGSGMFGMAAAAVQACAEEAAAAEAACAAPQQSGIGTIAAVQAPSMHQLLTPAPISPNGTDDVKRTSGGKRLLMAFGKKWSLGGRKDPMLACTPNSAC